VPAVSHVLVAGAGLAGAAVATHLAAGGVDVDLIEVAAAGGTALGSGITLQGNALRELRRLGVWDQVRSRGYSFGSLGLRAPDAAGTLLVELPDVRSGGSDLPATVGMLRPALVRILQERAASAGAKIRFGTSYSGLDQDASRVFALFADGTAERYDLVIAADGIRSPTRRLLGIATGPRPTGMGIWRALGARPASVTRTDLIYGGPSYIAGYCPTGPDSLYAYVVEDARDRSSLTPEQRLATMLDLAAAYHGPWDEIRPGLTDPSAVNYTWFETHVLPVPWNRGRVVLIGDAAHSCPPTLAQGGAQALEDAAVLAELLLGQPTVDEDLWAAFHRRRFGRAKTIVDASNQLAQWLLDHEQGDVSGLAARVTALVSQPA
jgi:2-polyprenyl-6-methoxyphenol hydroxylase-like FAD-dependent oxidoreductase